MPRNHSQLPRLSAEVKRLLVEVSQDEDGILLRTRSDAELGILSNGRDLVDGRDPRTEARWEAALRQLCRYALLREKGHKGEVFGITDEGYRVAEILRELQPSALLL